MTSGRGWRAGSPLAFVVLSVLLLPATAHAHNDLALLWPLMAPFGLIVAISSVLVGRRSKRWAPRLATLNIVFVLGELFAWIAPTSLAAVLEVPLPWLLLLLHAGAIGVCVETIRRGPAQRH